MNFKKALDRTKQGRVTPIRPTVVPERRREVAPQAVVPARRREVALPSSTWQPPRYSQSRTVQIDIPMAIMNHCVAVADDDYHEVSYYKVLRTQLRQICRQNGWNTIMVTSANPDEGKTITAINLAATYAREFNQTVLLVDADLRMQKIHRYLGYSSPLGLLDYLEGSAAVNEIVTWPGIDQFTIISGDRVVDDSSEMIGSPRMQALVNELKHRYDDRTIIFDVPPILGGDDALAFAPLMDCILVVVGASATNRQDLKKALELLPQDKIAGFALNRFSVTGQSNGRR